MRVVVAWTFVAATALYACGEDAADPLFDKGNHGGGGGAGAGGAADGGATASGGTATSGAGGATIGGGGGTSGSAGAGNAASGSGGSDACVPVATPAVEVPANLLIVFDRSGSMDEGVNPGGSGATKWSIAKASVNSALAEVTTSVNVGFSVFPAGKFDDGKLGTCFLMPNDPTCKALLEDGGCQDIDKDPGVPLAPVAEARPAIAELLEASSPRGATPTRWALEYAWEYLRNKPGEGQRYVVLITDGQPQTAGKPNNGVIESKTCGSLSELAARTTEARSGSPSVKTFAIGSPGDIDHVVLSGLALNGGTAKAGCTAANYQTQDCHYQLEAKTYGKGLATALLDIIDRTRDRCLFAVPADADTAQLGLTATGSTGTIVVPRDVTGNQGWDFTDETRGQVRVFGAACTALLAGEVGDVQILSACAADAGGP